MPKSYLPNLKDLALETGLSISTVSRSINGKGEISAETRAKIQAAAKKLGYVSNISVQGMMNGGTRTIGVMLNVADHFFASIFKGVNKALYERGYAALLAIPSGLHQSGPPFEPDLLRMMLERRVEGLILRPLAAGVGDAYFGDLLKRGMPIVQVDAYLENLSAPFIGTEDFEGGRQAALRLLSAGHRRILHFAGEENISTGRLRAEGFLSAKDQFPDAQLSVAPRRSFSVKPEEAAAALRQEPRPTAVFAASDSSAASVCKAARSLGLRVPEDLSVIGFSNSPLAGEFDPAISSFEQFPERQGEEAVKALFKLIADAKEERHSKTLLKPQLVERNTIRSLP